MLTSITIVKGHKKVGMGVVGKTLGIKLRSVSYTILSVYSHSVLGTTCSVSAMKAGPASRDGGGHVNPERMRGSSITEGSRFSPLVLFAFISTLRDTGAFSFVIVSCVQFIDGCRRFDSS